MKLSLLTENMYPNLQETVAQVVVSLKKGCDAMKLPEDSPLSTHQLALIPDRSSTHLRLREL